MSSDDRRPSVRRGLVSLLRAVVPDVVRRRYTLKFAVVLLVMALVVGAIGVSATGLVASEVKGNVENEQRDLATQKANVVEKWVQRNSISVRLASKNDALSQTGGRSRYDIRGELATTGANLDGVNAVYLAEGSSDGMRVVASPQIPFDTDVTDAGRGWLLDVGVERMGVAEVHISDVYKVDGRPVIAFGSPVQGTEDRYLVVEYDVGSLARSLQQRGTATGFTQVVDESGTVQVAARSSEIDEPYGGEAAMTHVEEAHRLADQPGPSAGVVARAGPHPDVMDVEYTVGYAPVRVDNANVDWVVLVHEPTRNVFGFPQAISLWGQVATLAGVVFIAVLGGAIGYSTTHDIRGLREKAAAMRAGNLDVDIHSPRIDSIGQLYDGFDEMRVELKRQIEEATRARRDAERSRAEAERMSQYLQRTAEEYSATMERCAAGDLTRRMDADGENEAMDRIAHDFNDMVRELERTTGQLKRFAEEVEATGEALQSSAESVKVSSEHVADSVQTISDDAWEQKDSLEALSAEIDGLVTQFETYAEEHEDLDLAEPLERLSEVADRVSEVAGISEQTLGETEIVAGAAQEQTAELTAVSRRAADLTGYARPLREVLGAFDTAVDEELDPEHWTESEDGGLTRVDRNGGED
jgi:methyl-accepting chemotaxis protein